MFASPGRDRPSGACPRTGDAAGSGRVREPRRARHEGSGIATERALPSWRLVSRCSAGAPTSLTIADTAPGPERENGMTRDVASAERADMPRLLPTKVGKNHADASP